MKKKQRRTLAILLLLALGIFLFSELGLLTIFRFEFGWLPYGESPNQITDLIFVRSNGALEYSSRYWDIEQIDYYPKLPEFACAGQRDYQAFSGNDFELISAPSQSGGRCRNQPTETIFISTENFDEKDFRTEFEADIGRTCVRNGEARVEIYLTGDSGKVGVVNHLFVDVINPPDLNVIISPSVITDKVFIYEQGEKTNEVEYAGNYKINILMYVICGEGENKIIMREPAYKQSFGCTKEPYEQYYVMILMEGDDVELEDLPEFRRFCLEEAPLKIWTNIGSTTNTEVLVGLVEGERYTIPDGQIWSIEYIGNMTDRRTQCEIDETFNWREEECLSRTVVTLICPTGSNFNWEKGYCTVETEPTLYYPSPIQTHQNLETKGQFRFTHIFEDGEHKTPTSVSIGEDTFSSGGAKSFGGSLVADFSFNAQPYQLGANDEAILNDYLSVEITDIDAYVRDNMIESFMVEYTFSFDVSFLPISYSPHQVKVENTYKSFNGGIVLTTKDKLGNTIVKPPIEKRLNIGKTTFEIDPTNLVELKARPFIILDMPQYEYRLDGKYAVIVKDFESSMFGEPEKKPLIGKELEEVDIMIYVYIIIAIAIIVLLVFLLKKVKKR